MAKEDKAKIALTQDNVKSLFVFKTAKGSGYRLDENKREIEKLTSRIIEVSQYIPAELVSAIGEELARGKTANKHKVIPSGYAAQFVNMKKDGKNGLKEVASIVTSPIRRIQQAYYSYYIALLKGMDSFLQNPGIPAPVSEQKGETFPFQRNIKLDLSELPYDGKGVPNLVQLNGQWPTYSPLTAEQKAKPGIHDGAWKHSGEAYRDFHMRISRQLSRVTPRSFMKVTAEHVKYVKEVSSIRIDEGSYVSRGPGQHVRSVNYTFEIQVPKIDPKLDRLITIPFASGQMPYTVAPVSPADGVGPETGGPPKPFEEHRQHKANLKGIDHYMEAESRRPILRLMSAKVGAMLESYISGMAVSRPSQSPLAQRAAITFAKAAKARAEQQAKEKAATVAAREAKHLAEQERIKRNKNIAKKHKYDHRGPFEAYRNFKNLQRLHAWQADKKASRDAREAAKRPQSRINIIDEEPGKKRGVNLRQIHTSRTAEKLWKSIPGVRVNSKVVDRRKPLTEKQLNEVLVSHNRVTKELWRDLWPKKPKKVRDAAPAPAVHHPGQHSLYRPVNPKAISRILPNDFELRMLAIKKKR